MKEVKGNKVYKEDADLMLVQGCHDGDLSKVVRAVELYEADVNAMDAAGYARALIYALRCCNGNDDVGETIVKYLINNGAEVNFKHGDKYSHEESRPYFVYWVAENRFASDDLVYFVITHSDKENLYYKPTSKAYRHMYEGTIDVIKKSRPKLYKKLLDKKVITPNKR